MSRYYDVADAPSESSDDLKEDVGRVRVLYDLNLPIPEGADGFVRRTLARVLDALEAAEQSVTTLRERYNALLETQVAAERERLELQQKVEELEREVVQLREQKAPAT